MQSCFNVSRNIGCRLMHKKLGAYIRRWLRHTTMNCKQTPSQVCRRQFTVRLEKSSKGHGGMTSSHRGVAERGKPTNGCSTGPRHLLIIHCAWLHTFSSQPVPTSVKRWICLTWNDASSFFTPSHLCQQHETMDLLFVDEQFNAWKQKINWDEKRMENCFSCPSPSVYTAYLSVVIGPFNIPGENAGRMLNPTETCVCVCVCSTQ